MDIATMVLLINEWTTQVEKQYDSKTVYMTAVRIETDYPVENGMIPSSHQSFVTAQERALKRLFNEYLEEYHVLLEKHSPRPKAEQFINFFVERLPHNDYRWDDFEEIVYREEPSIKRIDCENHLGRLAHTIFHMSDQDGEDFLNHPEDIFVMLHLANRHNKDEWKTVAVNLRQCAAQLMVGQLYKTV